jgi:hypothetical protein
MSVENLTSILPVPARYCPYSQLGDQPNIIVDGKEQQATVLTLSHWPWNSTPEGLLRDTSTDIVFAYIDSPHHHVDIPLVSNNHFDEDGLLSMYALVDPASAIAHRELMIATSRAGDFSICTSMDAAKLSFILAAHADPEFGLLPAEIFAGSAASQVHGLYAAMLEKLPALMRDIPDYKVYWEGELAHWQESERAIAEGHVVIDEIPDMDLAIVHVPEDMPVKTVRRYLQKWQRSVHPFAVHNVTQCSRIVWIKGASIEMQYRYESWLQLASRKPLMRVDLAGLAKQLCDKEMAGGEWVFEGVNEVAPRLHLKGSCRSSISADEFMQQLSAVLLTNPPAWDPYNRPD